MLAVFVGLGVLGSCGLFFVTEGQYQLASAFYIIGNVGFAGSLVFYESLLPHIASPEEVDRVSVAGYAIGYVGGGVLLVINLLMIQMPELFGFPGKEADSSHLAVRATFLTVGIWWALFSMPVFLRVKEPPRMVGSDEGVGVNPLTIGFKRLVKTFAQIRQYDQLFLFLIAFWFYSDGIGTIIKMATVYGAEIGLDQSAMIGAIVLVQFLGIPCTFLYGPIAQRLGVRGGIIFTLVIYTIICVLGYFMETSLHFWMLACALAFVQGGAQALSRSYYSSMVPPSMSSEFFAFYSVSSKFAGIFGPLLFGLVAQVFSGSRFAILFLVAFFLIGIVILLRVDHAKGRAFAIAKEQEFAKVKA